MNVLERTVIDDQCQTWELPVASGADRVRQMHSASGVISLATAPGALLYGADRDTLARWHAALVASFALTDEAAKRGVDGLTLAKRFVKGDDDLLAALKASMYIPTLEERSFSLLGQTFTFPLMPPADFDQLHRWAIDLVERNGYDVHADYIAYWAVLAKEYDGPAIRFADFVQALREAVRLDDYSAMRAALFATGRITSVEEFDSISEAACAHRAPLEAAEGDKSKEQASDDADAK